jgi:hypothetical protein
MDSLFQLAGSTALEAAMQGLDRSKAGLQGAADEVLEATVQAVNGAGGTADTVSISDVAHGISNGSLEGGLLDAKTSRVTYAANIAVVRTVDEQFEDMLDMIVPGSTRQA